MSERLNNFLMVVVVALVVAKIVIVITEGSTMPRLELTLGALALVAATAVLVRRLRARPRRGP